MNGTTKAALAEAIEQDHPCDDYGCDIASVPNEDVTPYYVAARSPYETSDKYETPESVILKRFGAHEAGDYYPWQIGPSRFYHVLMTPDTHRFSRGPEPAGNH